MSQKAKLQNTMDAMQVSTLEILNVNQQRIYLLQNQHNYKAFYFRFLEASRRQQLIQHEVLRRHYDFRDTAHSLPDVRVLFCATDSSSYTWPWVHIRHFSCSAQKHSLDVSDFASDPDPVSHSRDCSIPQYTRSESPASSQPSSWEV